MNKWIKLGLVFTPPKGLSWMNSHAWVPTPFQINGSIYRIYFSGRDSSNSTQSGYFDIDLQSKSITNLSDTPILTRGDLGQFDDSLAVTCSVVRNNEDLYMYYVGWQQTARTRYLPHIGLAISTDNGVSFEKVGNCPLIPRQKCEQYGMASPFVLKEGDEWKMWYGSYRSWSMRGDQSWPRYEVRHATSRDGLNWDLINKTCLGGEHEEAVARPWVVKNINGYQMWYAYRKNFKEYRIGYAESYDGQDWIRKDEMVGIDVSDDGFDSEMIEYPSVIKYGDFEYMFYNGNAFGVDGIGLAVREAH